jgi:hypothetical protein
VNGLYIPRIGPHKCRNWETENYNSVLETENYNSVLEITVSFLEIHKWEPGIYIGFSMALHLQCGAKCIVYPSLYLLQGIRR